jgi:hypothetical protein
MAGLRVGGFWENGDFCYPTHRKKRDGWGTQIFGWDRKPNFWLGEKEQKFVGRENPNS